MKNRPPIVRSVQTLKTTLGKTIRLRRIELRDDLQVGPVLLHHVANISRTIPVLFICNGGECRLYSHGRLLRHFDASERLQIAPDDRGGIKVVRSLLDLPFDTKKAMIQSAPGVPVEHYIRSNIDRHKPRLVDDARRER